MSCKQLIECSCSLSSSVFAALLPSSSKPSTRPNQVELTKPLVKACTTALMAWSWLAIYCFFMSLCKHPRRTCPPESSCLRGQRLSLAMPSPGTYVCFLRRPVLVVQVPIPEVEGVPCMAAFSHATRHILSFCSASHHTSFVLSCSWWCSWFL